MPGDDEEESTVSEVGKPMFAEDEATAIDPPRLGDKEDSTTQARPPPLPKPPPPVPSAPSETEARPAPHFRPRPPVVAEPSEPSASLPRPPTVDYDTRPPLHPLIPLTGGLLVLFGLLLLLNWWKSS